MTIAKPDGWSSRWGIGLASFNNGLYMAYSDGTEMYVDRIDKDGEWHHTSIPDWSSVGGISLATFGGKLYMAYRGTAFLTNGGIYVGESSDGYNWETVFHKKNWTTKWEIGLASFNNELYMAYQGNDDRMYISESDDGENWRSVFSPNDWSAVYTIGLATFSSAVASGQLPNEKQLYMAYKGTGIYQQIYVAKYFSPLFLDVWGEGRIVTEITTGFVQSSNLNKRGKTVSNGPNEHKPIPSLIPIDDYDRPNFPIGDNMVRYMTLMGSPINRGTAYEMKRVLNKESSVVILYDPGADAKKTFEGATGLAPISSVLGFPFNQIHLNNPDYYVYFYGPPQSVVSLPSVERTIEKIH